MLPAVCHRIDIDWPFDWDNRLAPLVGKEATEELMDSVWIWDVVGKGRPICLQPCTFQYWPQDTVPLCFQRVLVRMLMPRQYITLSLPLSKKLSRVYATSLRSHSYLRAETGLNPGLLSSTNCPSFQHQYKPNWLVSFFMSVFVLHLL